MMPQDDPPSLRKLEEGIARFQSKAALKPSGKPQGVTGAMRTGLELLSGVLAGSFLGMFLDKWLGTSPVLLILCFLLGAGGGFLTVYRTMQAMDTEVTAVPLLKADEEDDE